VGEKARMLRWRRIQELENGVRKILTPGEFGLGNEEGSFADDEKIAWEKLGEKFDELMRVVYEELERERKAGLSASVGQEKKKGCKRERGESMIIIAGWKDEWFDEQGENRFRSMREARAAYPEVLGPAADVEEAIFIVRDVNREGNYEEFVFIVVDGEDVKIA
jgi:hypothetical protein